MRMASGVSVEKAALEGGIACCKTSIYKLESASRNLQRGYQQAGSGGWRDQKYAQLGGIVEECCSALTKPISELQACMGKLQKLLETVNAYEETGLSATTVDIHHSSSGISSSQQVMSCTRGEYHYEQSGNNTRHVYGQLQIVPRVDRHRSQSSQRAADGLRRRSDDDGGHLIGARFGGASGDENLFPQNRNLNRSGYKLLENLWESLLKNCQVYVDIYTSSSNDSMREDAIYGSYTVIRPDGSRYTEGFSYTNEDSITQENWEEDILGEDDF